MNDQSEAFRAVLKNPHSVTARRRLAQEWRARSDPRAEFIEEQLARHDGLNPTIADSVRNRIRAAIKQHGVEWAGKLAEHVSACRYELGLVAGISLGGYEFIARARELVSLAPIVDVSIWSPLDLGRLAEVPELAQVRRLFIEPGPWLNDTGVQALAASPYARNLRCLELSDGKIDELGLRALQHSPNLRDIAYVNLTGNPCAQLSRDGTYYVNGGFFIARNAGVETLAREYEVVARSYDVGGRVLWPGPPEEYIYEE